MKYESKASLSLKLNYRKAEDYQIKDDGELDTDEAINLNVPNGTESRNNSIRSQAKTVPVAKTQTKKAKQNDEVIIESQHNEYGEFNGNKKNKNRILKHKKVRHNSMQKINTNKIKTQPLLDDKRHTIYQDVLIAYQKYIRNVKIQQRCKSVPKYTHRERISKSREIDKSKQYGFRTLKTDNLTESNQGENSQTRQTPFTEKLIKEYYTNKGCIPKQKIYDALFTPVGSSRYLDKKSQDDLTERLMKHKDKVREKNKLSKIQQDFIQLREAEEKKNINKPTTVHHSEDYKMYEHQIKCEIRRKARMYDKAIEEKK